MGRRKTYEISRRKAKVTQKGEVMTFNLEREDTYSSEVLAAMRSFLNTEEFTDFKVMVNDKAFQCHKIILAASCPYFKALFESNMKECSEGEVHMDLYDSDILFKIIRTFYGEQVTFEWNQLEQVVEICDLLQVGKLSKKLEDIVRDKVNIKNCISLYKLWEKFNFKSAMEKAKSLMVAEFDEVTKLEEFAELYFYEVVDYIKDVRGLDNRVDSILFAVTRWIKFNLKSRKKVVVPLLRHIDLENCSSIALNRVVQENPQIFAETDVKVYLHDIFIKRLDKDATQSVSKQHFVALGGMTDQYDGTSSDSCWMFSEKYWEKFERMPCTNKQSPVVCVPNGFAVMCADNSKIRNLLYDLSDKKWSELPVTPVAMNNARAVFCEGHIFVFDGGAYVRTALSNLAYKLDYKYKVWTKVPELLEYQYCPIVCSSDDIVYVVYNEDICPKRPITLQSYKNGDSQWQFKANLPNHFLGTCGGSMVAWENCLYLVGGILSMNARYNIRTDTWSVLSTPKRAHMYGSACMYNGKLYLCGGGWATGSLSNVIEEYDLEKDSWTVSKVKLPQKLTFLTVAVLDIIGK